MNQILIDCDPGVDDSIAILFAANRPDVSIVGISTVFGNTSAATGATNALKLMELAGKEGVEVCAGYENPLDGVCEGYPTRIHGDNGLGNVELPEPKDAPVAMDVEDFIYEKARAYAGKLTLVCLGRLTNVAKAIERHPDLPGLVRKVVVMGGTLAAHGNVGPKTEANIGGDPLAADLAFQADWDVTLVGLDVTTAARMRIADVDRALMASSGNLKRQLSFICSELELYTEWSRIQDRWLGCCPIHDPLAMLVAVDPSVVVTRSLVTRVETGGSLCRGMVVVDEREEPVEGRYVRHAIALASDSVEEKILGVFMD